MDLNTDFPLFEPQQSVWFMMTDASGRPVKMIGRVVSHDVKTFTYSVWLPNNMIISVTDSLLHPYGDAVPFMNGSSTAPGSPVTMPRTASSSSFNFTLNEGNGKGNNEANSNVNFGDEENGDPWARMAAFLNARNGSVRNKTTKNTSANNGKGIPIPKGKKTRGGRRHGGRSHGGRRRGRRTIRRGRNH